MRTLLVEVDAHSHFLLTSDLIRRNVEKVIEYLQENAKIKDLLSKVNNEADKNDVTVCVYPICNFELKIEIRILINSQNMIPMKINDSDTDADLIKSSD